MDDEVMRFHGVLEPLQKPSTIPVVKKDFLLVIASSDDVVKGAWILDTQGSGHMAMDLKSPRSRPDPN